MSLNQEEPDKDSEVINLPLPFQGKDEMNLAVNPFAWLTDRPDPTVKTLKFTYPVPGKKTPAEWVLTGSDEYGLPLPGDEDILLVLIQLTREKKIEDRRLPITRFEILQRLKRASGPFSGAEYNRVRDALFRLKGTSLYATHWYDNALKKHLSFAGSIIDEVVLVDEAPGRKRSGGQPHLPLSHIIWSDRFFSSFKSGYIKSLDFDLYLTLSRPITKKLYRFLDTRFYDGKPLFEMNLRTLAHEHIGIQRSYKYESELKKTLKPAHEELKKIGIISGYDYRKGKEGTVVIYFAPVPEAISLTPISAPSNSEVLDQLVSIGVTRIVAERLLKEHTSEQIRLQIDCLKHRKPKNPPAILVKAIQEEWAAPQSYMKALRAEERRRTSPRKFAEENTEETRAFEETLKMLDEHERLALEQTAENMARERYASAAALADKGRGLTGWEKLKRSELKRLLLEQR